MNVNRRFYLVTAMIVTVFSSIVQSDLACAAQDEHLVSMTILQMNDVYEMTPVAGGAQGGLARVATVHKELLRKNPNTFVILAGDLFSPSAMGTAKVDGERLNGRHIVDVMNHLGLDYATFGNHEFDLPEEHFLKRLAESKTQWFSSNTFDAHGQSFPNVPARVVFTIANKAHRTVRVGLFGLTTSSNQSGYVTYADPMAKAKEHVTALRNRVDILIAVTHLPIDQDTKLVEELPEIDIVIGGHEHEDFQQWRGPDLTPIVKADANARTVYVHDFVFDTNTRKLEMASRLRKINGDIPDDPAVASRIQFWVEKAFAGFREQGFDAQRVVATTTDPLDGTEAAVRNHTTRLTELIALGILHSVPNAEWAIYNSGSIRIDDVLPPGKVTEYDIIRTLPFGGNVIAVDMKGSLLRRILDQGIANKGTGGFLQVASKTNNPAIKPEDTYLVAINDFLLKGKESGLLYLTRDNPDLQVRTEGAGSIDIRKALIAELQKEY